MCDIRPVIFLANNYKNQYRTSTNNRTGRCAIRVLWIFWPRVTGYRTRLSHTDQESNRSMCEPHLVIFPAKSYKCDAHLVIFWPIVTKQPSATHPRFWHKPAFSRFSQNCEPLIVAEISGEIVKRQVCVKKGGELPTAVTKPIFAHRPRIESVDLLYASCDFSGQEMQYAHHTPTKKRIGWCAIRVLWFFWPRVTKKPLSPAVGNSPPFLTQTCLFTISPNISTTIRGSQFWGNREKAGLSKTGVSCRRLIIAHRTNPSSGQKIAQFHPHL